MHLSDELFLIKSFPDFHESGFDINRYNRIFEEKNVIIHASAKEVEYKEHWGPLSIKCAIKGMEHYQSGKRFYSVDENHYLVFNDGQYYSSYIHSDIKTESFTINFSPGFCRHVLDGFRIQRDKTNGKSDYEFVEKLYQHNTLVTPLIFKLYKATLKNNPDVFLVTELYVLLLEKLLLQQARLKKEISKVSAVKYSTKVELYKRLYCAKDFIQSCYTKEIDIDTLASVAYMNKAHFLRTFKKYFGLTPYQYIISLRLRAAKHLLETTSNSVTEICFAVGYSDTASFCKLFKRNYSVTPEQYHRLNIKKSFFTC